MEKVKKEEYKEGGVLFEDITLLKEKKAEIRLNEDGYELLTTFKTLQAPPTLIVLASKWKPDKGQIKRSGVRI